MRYIHKLFHKCTSFYTLKVAKIKNNRCKKCNVVYKGDFDIDIDDVINKTEILSNLFPLFNYFSSKNR